MKRHLFGINRKGALTEGPIIVFMIIAFIALFVIFYLLFNMSAEKRLMEMESKNAYSEAQTALSVIMRTEVEAYGEKIMLSELLSRSAVDERYRRIARSAARKVITNNYRYDFPAYGFFVEYPLGEKPEYQRIIMDYGLYLKNLQISPGYGFSTSHSQSFYLGEGLKDDSRIVAEMLFPAKNREVIRAGLVRLEDKSDGVSFEDMASHYSYAGEILEDDTGAKWVILPETQSYKGQLAYTKEGCYCVTSIQTDKLKCEDGRDIPEEQLKQLELMIARISGWNDFWDCASGQPSQPDQGSQTGQPDSSASSPGQQAGLSGNELDNLKPGDKIELELKSYKTVFIKWGRIVQSEKTDYFSKESDLAHICPDGKARAYSGMYCCEEYYGNCAYAMLNVYNSNRNFFVSRDTLISQGYSKP